MLIGAKTPLSLKPAWALQTVKRQQHWRLRWLGGGGGGSSFVHIVTKGADCLNALDVKGTTARAPVASGNFSGTPVAQVSGPSVVRGIIVPASPDVCRHRHFIETFRLFCQRGEGWTLRTPRADRQAETLLRDRRSHLPTPRSRKRGLHT